MVNSQSWIPHEVDVERPNPARMYDYYLGGAHNFAADRELAEQALAVRPALARSARLNRRFLNRIVRYSSELGINQFLDLGSGIPTAGNVHHIAQQRNPAARIAYVDNESVAVAHSAELLAGNDYATITKADLRDAETVLSAPGIAGLLDFDQPIALLTVAVMHFIPDSEAPWDTFRRYRRALAPGSLMALSHCSTEGLPAEWTQVVELYKSSTTPVYPRTKAELERFFAGLELVEPGIVDAVDWHPDEGEQETERSGFYAAVARV